MKSKYHIFYLVIIQAILILLVQGVLAQALAKEEINKPNIIFIMSDDHTSQAISAYGGILSDVCPTPNIDRIAKEGMRFNNCFVTNSICTPSRAAIMTGKYAHKNGVYKFTALDQRQATLPKAMQAAGYQTAIVGKYHLYSNPVGMDYFSVLPGQGAYHDPELIETGNTHPSGYMSQAKRIQYQGHSSDVIADQALDYLQNKRKADQPFILFCQFKAPHDTWEYAKRYEEFLADIEIPEPANLFDDYEGRSDALKKQLQYIGSEWGNHTNFKEETAHLEGKAKRKMQYQLYMKKYLRCVKGVDDNVGRLLNYLDESGLAENTIIIYTGDQGFYLGEHGLYDKRFMYEESLRMPFLVRWPNTIKAGSVSDGIILNIDFASTILEAAGQPPLPKTQGKSFIPLLKGILPGDWRKSMYYRYYYSHFETEPHYGVRTYDHKLIYFNRIDQWELYDIKKDASEMNNVYSDPTYQKIVTSLKKELIRLQTELEDDPKNDGSRPNIGPLESNPLHQAEGIKLAEGNKTVLMRFQTDTGGTLFSVCQLGAKQSVWENYKTLYVHSGNLMFFDTEEENDENIIAKDVADGKPHTLAVVVKNGIPEFYLDGKKIHQGKHVLPKANPLHTFNIGAGLDDGGWLGYNFIGTINQALIYDTALDNNSIMAYAKGEVPKGTKLLEWTN